MFTRAESEYTYFILKLTSQLFTSPFDFKSGKLYPVKTRYRRHFNDFRLFVIFANLLIATSRLPATVTENIFPSIVLNLTQIITSLSLFVFQLNLRIHSHEMAAFFNQMTTLNRDFGKMEQKSLQYTIL